jgi:hypothetical protein
MSISLAARRFPRTRSLLSVIAAAALMALYVTPVAADAPGNDSIRSPIVIGSIPYTNSQNTSEATSSATDPGACLDPSVGRDSATVWYSYAATTSGPLGATTFGSDYDTTLYVGTLKGSRLQVVACGDDSRTLQSTARFDAVAGTTYFFMVGRSVFDSGGPGTTLVFNLDVGPVAQVVDLVVDPVGSVVGTDATFRGTVSCSAPTDLGSLVIAELTQIVDGKNNAGTGFLDVPGCPGTEIPFEIRVPSEIGRFRPGEGTAQFIYAACNTFECANETIDVIVTLER